MASQGEHGESSGPGFWRVLAVALGVGIASAFVFELHGHSCLKCGKKWRHLGYFNEGDIDAHTCRNCGQVQWWKDDALAHHHPFPHDDVPATSSAEQPALSPGPDANDSRRR